MLKAHLRNKLGAVAARLAAQGGESSHEALAWRTALADDEDSLTSSVMERFSYLSPGVAWKILSVACEPLGPSDVFPALPMRDPSWHFWPSWDAAPDSPAERVVPDVVIEFPDLVVIFEAKHRGSQNPEQWATQIRAAQHGLARNRRLVFVALGGLAPAARLAVAQHAQLLLQERGSDPVPMFRLAWERLPAAIESVRRTGQLHPGHLEALKDVDAALADRGYRPRAVIATLPAMRVNAGALADWKLATRSRLRALGFARFEETPIATAPTALPHWKVRP
jgi:hypothetical protein